MARLAAQAANPAKKCMGPVTFCGGLLNTSLPPVTEKYVFSIEGKPYTWRCIHSSCNAVSKTARTAFSVA